MRPKRYVRLSLRPDLSAWFGFWSDPQGATACCAPLAVDGAAQIEVGAAVSRFATTCRPSFSRVRSAWTGIHKMISGQMMPASIAGARSCYLRDILNPFRHKWNSKAAARVAHNESHPHLRTGVGWRPLDINLQGPP